MGGEEEETKPLLSPEELERHQSVNPLINGLKAGILQVHQSSALPWWATLVCCTIGFRVALLPLVNLQIKNMQRVVTTKAPKQFVEFTSLVARDLKLHKNDVFSQKALLKQYREGLGIILRKNDIKIWKFFIVPAIQIPTFVSYVYAVRGLSADSAIEEEMRTGGLAWFTDLTQVDAYYALPITALSLTYLTIERVWGFAPWIKNFLQTLTICSSPLVLTQLPSFVFMYWIPSASFGLAQTTFLRYYLAKQRQSAAAMVVPNGAAVKARSAVPRKMISPAAPAPVDGKLK